MQFNTAGPLPVPIQMYAGTSKPLRSGREALTAMFRWIFRLVVITLAGKLVNRYLHSSSPDRRGREIR